MLVMLCTNSTRLSVHMFVLVFRRKSSVWTTLLIHFNIDLGRDYVRCNQTYIEKIRFWWIFLNIYADDCVSKKCRLHPLTRNVARKGSEYL